MSVYLDTSFVVAVLTGEDGSDAAQDWLAAQPRRALTISDWVVAEFSSALSIKLRTGRITPEIRVGALQRFGRYASNTFDMVPVDRDHFRKAATYANNYALGLRAGDALHLAVASSRALQLCTLDRRMTDAAAALRIDVLPTPGAV